MLSEHIGKYLINIMDSYNRELEHLKKLKDNKSVREGDISDVKKVTKSILTRNNAVATYWKFTNNILLNGLYIEYVQFLNAERHTILFKLKYKDDYRLQPAFGDLFKKEEVRMEFQPLPSFIFKDKKQEERLKKSVYGKLEKRKWPLAHTPGYDFIPSGKENCRISCKEHEVSRDKVGSIYVKTDDIKIGVLEDLVNHFLL